MMNLYQYTGFAIAIAWPETYCKQPGYWYDKITSFLGFSKHHYYKVGHAALVLVDLNTEKCHYFDFGRYHTPFQTGRVRSELTDPGLEVKTIPKISNSGIEIRNYKDILTELQLNSECHGEGKLYASYCPINYGKAFEKANELQEQGPIHYGPFRYKGSNCSRFVNTAMLAGNPNWKIRFKLKYLITFTPTPINNVNSLNNKIVLPKMLTNRAFCPTKISDKSILKTTLLQPKRHPNVPKSAQWLSGEGAGSWFHITQVKKDYVISRYNETGTLEFETRYNLKRNVLFDINKEYKFIHLSHYNKVNIEQSENIFEFDRISESNVSSIQISSPMHI